MDGQHGARPGATNADDAAGETHPPGQAGQQALQQAPGRRGPAFQVTTPNNAAGGVAGGAAGGAPPGRGTPPGQRQRHHHHHPHHHHDGRHRPDGRQSSPPGPAGPQPNPFRLHRCEPPIPLRCSISGGVGASSYARSAFAAPCLLLALRSGSPVIFLGFPALRSRPRPLSLFSCSPPSSLDCHLCTCPRHVSLHSRSSMPALFVTLVEASAHDSPLGARRRTARNHALLSSLALSPPKPNSTRRLSRLPPPCPTCLLPAPSAPARASHLTSRSPRGL